MALGGVQLEINQSFAKIGMDIKEPELKLSKSKGEMSLDKGPGEQSIKKKDSKVNIDNYPAEYDLGYRNYKDFMKDFSQKGKKTALSQIAKYANEGDQLMRIESGGDPIVFQAKENSKSIEKDIGIRWKRGPSISVSKDQLDINYNPKNLKGNYTESNVSSELNWGRVNTYLKQKANLEINVRGNNLNRLS